MAKAKKIKVARKRKRPGRPKRKGGLDPVTAIRLPEELANEFDNWAAQNGFKSRSEAIRYLITMVLKA